MPESKTYTGGCHCGANKFSIPISPPLDSPEQNLMNCNCSICARNGYIFIFTSEDAFDWKSGGFSSMTEYKFKTGKFKHYFCPTCGTSVCVNAEGMGVGLNVRTIDDIDVGSLKITKTYDGKSI
ncbi:uncharacterized protein PV09_03077 [Verruconis gallopava]|uniref:CENP-V/GFA domain-containing protein n=1 Tax=Verruconis gallopava TaxID=253628 RepID=A0A0D1XT38_9PEZI|nr:uncharacterized protein PV09_03077 [Verruconis gallopava]KIW05881.1 hypothetical protein PV09_03077 [Verruconis gallopava]